MLNAEFTQNCSCVDFKLETPTTSADCQTLYQQDSQFKCPKPKIHCCCFLLTTHQHLQPIDPQQNQTLSFWIWLQICSTLSRLPVKIFTITTIRGQEAFLTTSHVNNRENTGASATKHGHLCNRSIFLSRCV